MTAAARWRFATGCPSPKRPLRRGSATAPAWPNRQKPRCERGASRPNYFELVSAETLRPAVPLAGESSLPLRRKVGPVRLN